MPDQQPAATENTPVTPNDADTAATAMTGIDGDLGPRTGSVPAGGAGAPLGAAPNATIDVPTPHAANDESGAAEVKADRQAQTEAAAATARET